MILQPEMPPPPLLLFSSHVRQLYVVKQAEALVLYSSVVVLFFLPSSFSLKSVFLIAAVKNVTMEWLHFSTRHPPQIRIKESIKAGSLSPKTRQLLPIKVFPAALSPCPSGVTFLQLPVKHSHLRLTLQRIKVPLQLQCLTMALPGL